MNQKDFSIEVFSHFAGSAKVAVPAGFTAKQMPAPKDPALTPPEALRAMEPGELKELRVRRRTGKNPLVLASHGRKANLTNKRKTIEAARAANRKIEIHVFDKPPGGP